MAGNFSGSCFGDASSQIVKSELLVSFDGQGGATVNQDPLGKPGRYVYYTTGTTTDVPYGQTPQTTPFYAAWNLGAQGPIALHGYVGAGGRLVGSYTNGMSASGESINCNFDLSPL